MPQPPPVRERHAPRQERILDTPQTVAAYESALLTAIAMLTARMALGGLLLDQLPEQIADDHWRVTASAEFRSWRAHLDALPAEPPIVYAGVHVWLLRWAAALADTGDAYAAAIEARSAPQLQRASRTMARVPALYQVMEQALVHAVAQMEP